MIFASLAPWIVVLWVALNFAVLYWTMKENARAYGCDNAVNSVLGFLGFWFCLLGILIPVFIVIFALFLTAEAIKEFKNS